MDTYLIAVMMWQCVVMERELDLEWENLGSTRPLRLLSGISDQSLSFNLTYTTSVFSYPREKLFLVCCPQLLEHR